MVLDIKMDTARKAADLNTVATQTPFVMFVHSKDGMAMVDARSLINLLPLVGTPCYLVAEDDTDPKAFRRAAERAGIIE